VKLSVRQPLPPSTFLTTQSLLYSAERGMEFLQVHFNAPVLITVEIRIWNTVPKVISFLWVEKRIQKRLPEHKENLFPVY